MDKVHVLACTERRVTVMSFEALQHIARRVLKERAVYLGVSNPLEYLSNSKIEDVVPV